MQGDAWDGANRTLLYAAVYATFALLCWRTPEAVLVLGLFALGTAAIGGLALATEGVEAFNGNRLAAPTGYENASAALFLMAFWPAVALAARPEVHWAARGLLLAAGGLLLQLALLAQSRGSLVAGACRPAGLVLASRDRLRLLAVLLLVSAAVAATLVPLLDIVAAGSEAEVRRAVGAERVAVALSTVALLPDRRARLLRRPDRPRSQGPAAAHAPWAALWQSWQPVSRSSLSALARRGDARRRTAPGPGDAVATTCGGWPPAKSPTIPCSAWASTTSRSTSSASARTGEEPLYPHSLALRTFSQTGLVGGVLFLGFVAAALAAALPRRREPDSLRAAVAAASLAIRRLLARPRLDRLAVGDPRARGLRARLVWGWPPASRDRLLAKPPANETRPAAMLAAPQCSSLVAAGSLALPGLAAIELERGVRAWPDSPTRALSHLERAHRLNPLSERADVVAGTLAQRERRRRAGPCGVSSERSSGILTTGTSTSNSHCSRKSGAGRRSPI